MATQQNRPLAVITGASTGIGRELARVAVAQNYNLVIAADEPEIEKVAAELRGKGAEVDAVDADLATLPGVDKLIQAIRDRPVDALLANAGRGLGHGFLDQNFGEVRHVIDTNVTGTLYLIHQVVRKMVVRKHGRLLITGSIAGFFPGTFHAVYNATKAFLDSFSFALRAELKGSGVTVTCLMPGATETDFFERADLMDTAIGQQKKDDPAMVAQQGWDAMIAGEGDVVTGWMNKLRSAMANVTPAETLAEQHRAMTEPGSGKH